MIIEILKQLTGTETDTDLIKKGVISNNTLYRWRRGDKGKLTSALAAIGEEAYDELSDKKKKVVLKKVQKRLNINIKS